MVYSFTIRNKKIPKEALVASFFFLQKNPDFSATPENPLFFVYYAQEFALFDRIFWKAGILTNSGVSVTIDSGRATGAPKILKGKTENEASQKCEKMENEKKTGYVLYDFMKEDLDLSGVALQVYALIYSFTKAGGDCHGSVRYIAQRTGSGKSSVHRALNELLEKQYIVKLDNQGGKTCHYVANQNSLSQNGTVCLSQNDTVPVPKSDTDGPKMGYNNKEDNKEDNNTNLLTNHSFFQGKPRPIQPFGREKVVMMTLHQYANLLRAIGVMPTRRYIAVLERQIRKFSAKAYKDHYQTIIGWARKDGLVTPEGEIILKN